MYKLPIVTFILLFLVGCAQETELEVQPNDAALTPVKEQKMTQKIDQDISWIDYADAKADANLEMAKGNFELLAFTNKTIALPGVDMQQYNLQQLEQKCGFRFLVGTGDILTPETDIQRRKQLRIYATQYNQLVLSACIKR